MTKRALTRFILCLAMTAGVLALARPAAAMPLFSRREHIPCASCHSQVPRLNRFGYDYRRAGFRLPENLGKEERTFDLGDLFAARFQASGDLGSRKQGDSTTNTTQIQFREFTMYPLTGSWGRYFSSLTELSQFPEDFFEVENAYVRGNVGQSENFWHARFGIFHPFEGYGASDRPLGLSRPLLQGTAANFDQSTFFTPWGFDEAGLEIGHTYRGFSISAAVLNGLFVRSEDAASKAFPAQGGQLLKLPGSPANNAKDLQLFVNQMIGETLGFSAYYYHGWLDLPKDPTMAVTAGNLWTNSFDRAALYGYGQVVKHLALQGGAQVGIDHRYDTTTDTHNNTFKSVGAFAEAIVPLVPNWSAGARYDYFDPATAKGSNSTSGGTAIINYAHTSGLQLIGEYRYLRTALGPDKGSRQNHAWQLRLIFIL